MSTVSTPYYKVLDTILIFLSCSFAYWARFETLFLPIYYFLPTVVFALSAIQCLSISNFYQQSTSSPTSNSFSSAATGLALSAAITIVCIYLTKTGEDYSRIWLTSSVILATFLLLLSRYLLGVVFNISTPKKTFVLVGANKTALKIEEAFKNENKSLVLLEKRFSPSNQSSENSILSEIARYVEDYRTSDSGSPINEIWLTHDIFNQIPQKTLQKAFGDTSASIVFVPEFPEFSDTFDVQLVNGIPTINSVFTKEQKIKRLAKFMEDQIIAWTALILLSPVLIIIGALIKYDSKGPIFFKQARYGYGGKEFKIWKFRTMSHSNTPEVFKQAQVADPRITNIGHFLRRSSLDELPQLINVINGTMSVVGPRPHPVDLNEKHRGEIEFYMNRHILKPGITGLAQVNGYRGETPKREDMKNRVKYDLEYVQNWSILLDLKILLRTISHLVTTDKAR